MDLVKNNIAVFTISLILIGLTIFLLSLKIRSITLACIPGGVGIIGIIVLFYISRKPNVHYPSYYNPLSLVMLCIISPLGVFIITNLVKQLHVLWKGYNIKQYNSIMKTKVDLAKIGKEINSKYIAKVTCCKGFKNIFDFLIKPTMPSHINKNKNNNKNNKIKIIHS